MLKKLQAALVAVLMVFGLGAVGVAVAGPAAAHQETCLTRAAPPTPVGRSHVQGTGSVYCPDTTHISSIRVQAKVQAKLPVGVFEKWLSIPPAADSSWAPASHRYVETGTVITGARHCKWYRTQARAILSGPHGTYYGPWRTSKARQICRA